MQKNGVEYKVKAAFIILVWLIMMNTAMAQVTNVKQGLWSDTTVWSDHELPTYSDSVFLSYDIIIDTTASCAALNVNGHNVTVDSGVSFTVTSIHLLGGYSSSDSIAAANLIAYFPFDGNSNDVKGGVTATATGVTYTTGLRGLAYQGASNAYATLVPNAAFSNLNSYTLSEWFNLPAEPTQTPFDPEGLFFLSGTTNQAEIINEIEPYIPVSKDSVRIHAGFDDLASPSWQLFVFETFDTMAIGKWVHFVMTYDGASSTFTVYQNGIPIDVTSPWSIGNYVTSTTMYDGALPVGSGTPPTQLLGNISFASDPPQQITIGTWPATLFGVSPTLGSNGCFLGQLDELRVYNKALTQDEITGLYLNGEAGR